MKRRDFLKTTAAAAVAAPLAPLLTHAKPPLQPMAECLSDGVPRCVIAQLHDEVMMELQAGCPYKSIEVTALDGTTTHILPTARCPVFNRFMVSITPWYAPAGLDRGAAPTVPSQQ